MGARLFSGATTARRPRRNNPLSRNPYKAYKQFHWGNLSKKTRAISVAPTPKELVDLGTLENITYGTKKGGEDADYTHDFGKRGRGKPRLAYDPTAKALHIVGGTYTVEDRGIVG